MARYPLTTLHGREVGLAQDRSIIVRTEPDSFTFTPAQGSSNVSLVTIQAVNNEGLAWPGAMNPSPAVPGPLNFDLWVSDAATGAGLAAHANTSELTCSTGQLLGILTTEKAWRIQTDATGKAVVSITDTAKTGYFVCAQVPGRYNAVVSAQLTAANYG